MDTTVINGQTEMRRSSAALGAKTAYSLPMPTFQTIARTSDIPRGRGRAFQVGDRIIAVFEVAGTYSAIDDLCPHMGASLAEGEVRDGIVTCPWHAWRFRVSDGTWCDNTRVRTHSYPVRVVDKEIQVLIPDDE